VAWIPAGLTRDRRRRPEMARGRRAPHHAVHRLLHSLGRVNRLGEALQGAPAAPEQLRRPVGALVGEEVPALDLGQPARELLQVLLALLHLGERVLPRPGLPGDLVEQGGAALVELVILPASVGTEAARDRLVHVRRRDRYAEDERGPALPEDVSPQLLEELGVRRRIRQHPGAIDDRGRADGPQAAP
jgi:hypothetical protein